MRLLLKTISKFPMPGFGKHNSHRKAKIINRGSCRVEMGAKKTTLGVECGTTDAPEFLILVPERPEWETPAGERITIDEISEMQEFIPDELLKRDGVPAIVEVFAQNRD